MVRNVVSLVPRWRFLRSARAAHARIAQALAHRYRYRTKGDPPHIVIDFPKSIGGRAAKTEVESVMDDIDPHWRRLFRIYPTEAALRRERER